MGSYNEKASLISGIVKISLIILLICLIGITNALVQNEDTSTVKISTEQTIQS